MLKRAMLGVLILTACSQNRATPLTIPGFGATPPPSKIAHVVFIVQENRTFDNIFGGPNPFPGADAVSSGQTSSGKMIPLTEVNLEKPLIGSGDPNNYHLQWLTACNAPSPPPFPVGEPAPCRMNGFDLNAKQQPGYPAPPGVSTIYSYANRREVAPYWFIAEHYALGDHFFMGHNSESYTAHQYIFSSQSNGTVDSPVYPANVDCNLLHDYCAYTPWGCDSPAGTLTYLLNLRTGSFTGPPAPPNGPAPCFGKGGGYPSIADLAQAKGVSWRLYAYSMCSNIVGLDVNYTIRYSTLWPDAAQMANCYSDYGVYSPLTARTAHFRAPQSTFLTDMSAAGSSSSGSGSSSSSSAAGPQLASITWILPGPYTSDHPGVPFGYCGPTWVANVINAIGNSKYWKSTVIFVLWDDWGGFYDHVPPYVVRDQAGPGFRVPLLVVSPYVRAGSVVHTNIEFATLNNFVEATFGLGSLGATDASPYINNLDAFFDFSQAPLKFTPIPAPDYLRCSYLSKPGAASRAATRSRWFHIVGADDD